MSTQYTVELDVILDAYKKGYDEGVDEGYDAGAEETRARLLGRVDNMIRERSGSTHDVGLSVLEELRGRLAATVLMDELVRRGWILDARKEYAA